MKKISSKQGIRKQRKLKRQIRVRFQLRRSIGRPRLTVFRSNRYLWIQIINDKKGTTLLAATTKKSKDDRKLPPVKMAYELGVFVGQESLKKKIRHIRFDRGPYRYHGQVKAFAEGARTSGLQF